MGIEMMRGRMTSLVFLGEKEQGTLEGAAAAAAV